MIVLVGAVFADPAVAGSNASDGNAQLVVKAVISEDFPTYALKVKDGATGTTTEAAIAAGTPTTAK